MVTGRKLCGLLAMLALGVGAAPTAKASGLTDWALSPVETDIGDWTASLGGLAGGSAFTSRGAGTQTAGASLSLFLFPHLERELDNGWQIGLRGAILAYHDRLAGDIYGDRAFEKAYLFAQTPFGRIEIGRQDGAAYALAVTGPRVDDAVAIDNAGTTFFRSPISGRAFIDAFRLRTPEFASANDAKLTYLSPIWHGFQLGASYMPYALQGSVPFLTHGGSDRQTNLLEGAANYSGSAGNLVYSVYAGLTLGHDLARTAGHGDLVDWATGGEVDDTIGAVKLSLGGGFRQSNAHAFDIADARAHGQTRAWRTSATATFGPWIAGVEYAGGTANEEEPRSRLREWGYEPSLGYVLNSNLQLTAGWQTLHFEGQKAGPAQFDAAFLHLRFHV